MTAMIEALSFLGPHGPVARDEQSCICFDSLHAAGVCLGTIQARTHVQLALACQRSMIFAQRKLRLTMQHVYGRSGIWVMNVLTMPLHLGPSALPLTITLPPAGFIITLMHPRVLMAVTTSLRSWNDYNAVEQMQRRFPQKGVSIVFTIGFIVFVVHLTRISLRFVYLALSLFLLGYCFLGQVMESLSSSASTVPSFDDYFAHNMWNPLLELLFLEQVSGIFASFVVEIDLAKIALSCHFALDLLCYKEGAFDSA